MNKCNNKCFDLQTDNYNLCIKEVELDFEADMGYVGGNLSYRPLSEKPQINFRILESGNNTYKDLGIQEEIVDISEQDIDQMMYGG